MSRDDFSFEPSELYALLPTLPVDERGRFVSQLLHACPTDERQAAVRRAAAILTEQEIVHMLRNGEDDVLRNAGLEMLKLIGDRAVDVALGLLEDDDEDVVLQAVMVLDSLAARSALNPLLHVLETSTSVNIRQAAIVAVGHLRDPGSVPHLISFLHGDPWLQMASVQALGEIGCRTAIPALRALLSDSFLGPLVIESLGRLGGHDAFSALADFWSPFVEMIDAQSIEALADVAEGLEAHDPDEFAELRTRLARRLTEPNRRISIAAARCVLSLGPDPGDWDALSHLALCPNLHAQLPRCLARRRDLVPYLLRLSGKLQVWGTYLMQRDTKEGLS